MYGGGWQRRDSLPHTAKGLEGMCEDQGGPLGPRFFFLLRTALKDRPKGPPTANYQPPPNADQPPAANHCQPPPTTNHQPPTATNRHQPPVANCQPPTATNCHQPWLNI